MPVIKQVMSSCMQSQIYFAHSRAPPGGCLAADSPVLSTWNFDDIGMSKV